MSGTVLIEWMTFRVRAVVLEFNLQDDKDFHVVIAQPNNQKRTMIIEFPDPVCSGVCKSDHLEKMRSAREAFITQFGMPKKKFTELDDPVLVEIVGVGFFDRMHGQRGRALPSGIELHQILAFRVIE